MKGVKLSKKKRSRDDMLKDPITMKVPRLAHAIVKVLQAKQKEDLSLGESLIQYMITNHPDIVAIAERAIDLELADYDPYKQAIEDSKPQQHKRNG